MSAIALFSRTTLADAASGRKLPTWDVAKGYLEALPEMTEAEIGRWALYHNEVSRTLLNLAHKVGKRSTVADDGTVSGDSTTGSPATVEFATPEQVRARPDTVRTFDDLVRELNTLRISVGSPSFRSIAARSHWAASTICEVFGGRRRPALDVLEQIVVALYSHAAGEPDPSRFATKILGVGDLEVFEETPLYAAVTGVVSSGLADLTAWTTAWTTAEYNRQRPDLRSRSRRLDHMELQSGHQDRGPSIDILVTMPVPTAALLLGQMDPQLASAMLREMPATRSANILSQLFLLSAQGDPEAAVPSTVAKLTAVRRDKGPVQDAVRSWKR
uniref:hypothetical protein n=1 Tax=Amycolatopsis sp. CA-082387 TaxID=3239918 RepID=UPI003F493316